MEGRTEVTSDLGLLSIHGLIDIQQVAPANYPCCRNNMSNAHRLWTTVPVYLRLWFSAVMPLHANNREKEADDVHHLTMHTSFYIRMIYHKIYTEMGHLSSELLQNREEQPVGCIKKKKNDQEK